MKHISAGHPEIPLPSEGLHLCAFPLCPFPGLGKELHRISTMGSLRKRSKSSLFEQGSECGRDAFTDFVEVCVAILCINEVSISSPKSTRAATQNSSCRLVVSVLHVKTDASPKGDLDPASTFPFLLFGYNSKPSYLHQRRITGSFKLGFRP